MPSQEKIHASSGIYFCQPGCQGHPPREDHSLCLGPAALDQTEQSTSQRRAMSFGGECPGIKKGGGLLSVFYG